jgi:ABC-type Fe3+-siderophore transport system permease subunit
MNSSPIKRILLPAVGVSTSMFALFMVVFAIHISNEPPLPTRSAPDVDPNFSQMILLTEQGNARVRQVGLALIVSVGTGLVAVEALRRWYAFHDSGQIKAKQLGIEQFLTAEPGMGEESEGKE